MDKYLVTEIPENQHVMIDAPEGFMRVTGSVDEVFGDGNIFFVRESECGDVPLLQMRIRTPERARGIAEAFNQLADLMECWINADDCPACCMGCEDDDGSVHYEFSYEEVPDDEQE